MKPRDSKSSELRLIEVVGAGRLDSYQTKRYSVRSQGGLNKNSESA